MGVKIAPSLLAADFGRLAEEVADVERAGADMLHLDVMDGRFVPNITFGPGLIAALRPLSRLPFNAHLMIEEPWRFLSDFISAGADFVTVHAEACPHLHRTVQEIREREIRVGVAVNPATPLLVLDHVLDSIDLVLIMSVNPGFGGQRYLDLATDKIRQAARMRSDRGLDDLLIEVDGGITDRTAPGAINAGADILVAGTAVFGQQNRRQAIEALREREEGQ